MREIFMSGSRRAEGIRTSGFSSATLLVHFSAVLQSLKRSQPAHPAPVAAFLSCLSCLSVCQAKPGQSSGMRGVHHVIAHLACSLGSGVWSNLGVEAFLR